MKGVIIHERFESIAVVAGGAALAVYAIAALLQGTGCIAI